MHIRPLLRVAAALCIGAFVLIAGPATRAVADAAGCDSAHPTFIGGRIDGSDHRAVNVLIGMDLHNAAGQQIDANGVVRGQPGGHFCGGYSYCDNPNPKVAATGSTNPKLNYSWGRCVAATGVEAFIELYPRNPAGHTDKSRYGSAAHYTQPITPGASNLIHLQIPTTWEAAHGNTGWADGYLEYQGKRIPPEDITRFRAWTQDPGPACGIQGFSAGVDELAWISGQSSLWYKMDFLAAGQCGARSQTYQLDVDCTNFCGSGVKNVKQLIEIRRGRETRVDLNFS